MKAVIVLDKYPDICLVCPACNVDAMGKYKCMALNQNTSAHGRLPQCRAKELPAYKSIRPGASLEENMRYAGWNDCLNAVLGQERYGD